MSNVVPKGGLGPLAVDSAAYNELMGRIIETQPSTAISTGELEELLTDAAKAPSKPRMATKAQHCAFSLKQDGVDTYRDFAAVDLEMLRASGLNLIESRWVLDLLSPTAPGAPSLSSHAGSPAPSSGSSQRTELESMGDVLSGNISLALSQANGNISLALSQANRSMISAMAEQQEQALWVQVAGVKPAAFQPDASLPRSVARAKKWLKSLAVSYSMVPGVAPMIAELLADPAVTLGQSGRHLSPMAETRLFAPVRLSLGDDAAAEELEGGEVMSATALISNVWKRSVYKPQKDLASLVHAFMNQDVPIKTVAYLEARYAEWKGLLGEVMYHPAITREGVEDSARVLLQHFQPELFAAQRSWEKKRKAAESAMAAAADTDAVGQSTPEPFNVDAVQPYLAALNRAVSDTVARHKAKPKPKQEPKPRPPGKVGGPPGKGGKGGRGGGKGAPSQEDRKRRGPCTFFQMGRCNWGDQCRFSHEERVSLTVEELRATVAAEIEALMQPARCEDSPEKCAQGPPLTNSNPRPYSNPKSSAPVTSDGPALKFSKGVFRSVGDGVEWDGLLSIGRCKLSTPRR